jgi:Spy/CpxP family protein refolding chaperone
VSSETKWIAVLSALMLLIGIFLGIAMDRFLFRPTPPPPLPPIAGRGPGDALGRRFGEMALDHMTRMLALSADQQEKTREIFQRYMPEIRRARMEGGDWMTIRMKMHEEIRKVLTPEQFAKFEEMSRRRMGMRPEGALPTPPGAPAR